MIVFSVCSMTDAIDDPCRIATDADYFFEKFTTVINHGNTLPVI